MCTWRCRPPHSVVTPAHDDVVSLVHLLQELANIGGIVLQIAVHRDDDLTLGLFDALGQANSWWNLPDTWVVDCKSVGDGSKALLYLGRYLYRGVIQERDILRMDEATVTYRWRDSKTRQMQKRTVSGAAFLALVLQHVLPKGMRRARNCPQPASTS